MPTEVIHRNQSYATVFDVPTVERYQAVKMSPYSKTRSQVSAPEIIGREYADGRVFLAYQGVNLIPGGDSHFLAQEVSHIAATLGSEDHFTAIDVGTGCGIFATYIEHALVDNPKSSVIATDISGATLDVAQANFLLNGLQRSPELRKRDLLTDINLEFGKPNLIVSNPPFTPSDRVRKNGFEPNMAVDGGNDGMELYRSLLVQSSEILAPNGVIVLQIVEMGINNVLGCIKNTLPAADVGYIKNPTTKRICGLVIGDLKTIQQFSTGIIT